LYNLRVIRRLRGNSNAVANVFSLIHCHPLLAQPDSIFIQSDLGADQLAHPTPAALSDATLNLVTCTG
jgi:hypothetical protein